MQDVNVPAVQAEVVLTARIVYKEFGSGYTPIVIRYVGNRYVGLTDKNHFMFKAGNRYIRAIESRDKFKTTENSASKAQIAKDRLYKWRQNGEPGILMWLGTTRDIDFTLKPQEYVIVVVKKSKGELTLFSVE
jgi:hypothetical protein